MKKVSLMIAALTLVLGLLQCKKDEKPAASGEKQHVVLSASLGDGNSKIAEDGIGGLKWAEGDVINVFKGEQSLSEDGLTCTDPENGIFEGEIATTTGNITFTFGTQNFDGQSGLLNDAISLTSGEVEYKTDGNYNVRMTMPHAVLKLNVSALGTSGKLTISDGTSGVASVTNVTTPSEVFVAVPADGTQKNYTIGFGGKTATKVWTLAATFYTKSGSTTDEAIVIEPDTPAIPEGPLPGLFTVGKGVDGQAGTDDDVKVYFSKGNLYYDGENWGFEAEQYYFRTYSGNGKCDADGYSAGSGTADGHWGLFGWSNGSNNNYGMKTSTIVYDNYSGSFVDWGKNIGNGETWRTLTKDEWNYLINTRKVNGATESGYGKTCVTATVGSVEGLIIFPDGYTGATSGLSSIPEGCVFLPAAGLRIGTSVIDVGSYGNYWSSSCADSDDAYGLNFNSGYVRPCNYSTYRYFARSVRLVSEN